MSGCKFLHEELSCGRDESTAMDQKSIHLLRIQAELIMQRLSNLRRRVAARERESSRDRQRGEEGVTLTTISSKRSRYSRE
jgi:hypothetical protein